MNRILFSSQSVHWSTPRSIYDELDKEFRFDFDPCPLGEIEMDGLAESWKGKRVFCNPPYDRGIARFLAKSLEPDIAVFLLPSRTGNKWFHEFVLPNANEIRFLPGRLRFGGARKDAPFPSLIAIFVGRK